MSTLELADGSKFISEGKCPNVLFTLRNCTFKVQATVAKLFKGLDLILGMTWLEQVNPFIDWTTKRIFVQQDEEGNWVQGHWCPELKDARINVLNGQNVNLNENIKILKRPTFWNIASNKLSWRKVPQGGSSVPNFSHCADKNEQNEKNFNRKMNKNPTQVKNTQLIQANKLGKLIKDGEQAYLCMIRP